MSRALDEALKQAANISVMAYDNLFVNGFMNISQENGGALLSGNLKYPVDQFFTSYTVGVLNAQQIANPFPSMPEIAFGSRMTVATAAAALAATDVAQLVSSIEGSSLAKLRYGAANAMPLTVAFLVMPNYTGVLGWRLVSLTSAGQGLRSFVKRIPVVANQLQLVTFTIPGDTVQALLTGNVASLQAAWIMGSGSNFLTATTDQWVTGNFVATPDLTQALATVGNAITIGACVMFPGDFKITQDILPLLQRRYDDEFRLCARYYYKLDMGGGTMFFTQFGGTSFAQLSGSWPVPMRVPPTITSNMSVTQGTATNSYGNIQSNSVFAWMIRGDTTTSGYAQVSLIYANARM